MARYSFEYILTEPCEETEDMYFADLPAMPGCHAWGKPPKMPKKTCAAWH